jgi:hypothetical protein
MGLWLDPSASRDGLIREKALFLLQTEPPYLGPPAHNAVALPTIEEGMDTHVPRCMLLQTAHTATYVETEKITHFNFFIANL